jgi:hypothetical protein
MLGGTFFGKNEHRSGHKSGSNEKLFLLYVNFNVHCYREPMIGKLFLVHAARDEETAYWSD